MPSRAARRSSTYRSSVAPEDEESATAFSGTNGLDEGRVDFSTLEDPKYALASRFFATMMREVIIDTALHAHRDVTRQRRAKGVERNGCPVCKTSCQAPPSDTSHKVKLELGGGVGVGDGLNGTSGSGEENGVNEVQPKGLEIYHNNPLLACLVCSRQVSANRYAQHLASCVGVGKGSLARRKGKNGGSSKVKTALENRRKAGFSMSGASTPIQRTVDDAASMASDDESGRRKNTLSTVSGLNGNGKRSSSPSESRDVKKAKTGTPPQGGAESLSRPSSLLGVSAMTASQPAMGSPLNPNRTNKPIAIDDSDEDEDDGNDDQQNYTQESGRGGGSPSVASGQGVIEDASSDVYIHEESGSDANNDSDDESYSQSKVKGGISDSNTSDEEEY